MVASTANVSQSSAKPIPAIVPNVGEHGLSSRITFVLAGIVSPVAIWLINRNLPSWVTIIWMCAHHSLAIYARDAVVRDEYGQTIWIRIAAALIWTLLVYFTLRYTSDEMQLAMYHWLTGSLSMTANTYIWYLQLDGPSHTDGMACVFAKYLLITQFATCYVIENRRWTYPIVKSLLMYWCIPATFVGICIAVASEQVLAVKQLILKCLQRLRTIVMRIAWLHDFLDAMWLLLIEVDDSYHKKAFRRMQDRKRALQIEIPTFTYSSLLPGEIRLLVIHPIGKKLDPSVLLADLIVVPLAECPEYEAISYCWGDSAMTEEIFVNLNSFLVTSSALDVLRRRRRWFEKRTIWMDAICINQADLGEKTAQVQMMRLIYQKAARVVAFPDHHPSMRLVAPLLYDEAYRARFYGAYDSFWDLRPLLARGYLTERWKALKLLLRSEYFNRAWVIQEIAAARKVELYLHGFYVSWDTFTEAMTRYGDLKRYARLEIADDYDQRQSIGPKGGISNILFVASLRDDFYYKDVPSPAHAAKFEHLLERMDQYHTTDPRDRIFAIIGIASDIDRDNALLAPNYTKPVKQVYQDVARYLFAEQDVPSLNMLGWAGTGFTQSRASLPSWVPDFAENRMCPSLMQRQPIYLKQRNFSACGPRFSVAVTRISETDVLQLQGIFCDKILVLSPFTLVDDHTRPGMRLPFLELHKQKLAFAEGAIELLGSRARTRSLEFLANLGDALDNLYAVLTSEHIQNELISPKYKKSFMDWLAMNRAIAEVTDYVEAMRIMRAIPGQSVWAEERPWERKIDEQDVTHFNVAFTSACIGRKFGLTVNGRACLVPNGTKVGDQVFIPFGAKTPFVVRRVSDQEDSVQLVGEAYIRGIMRGEAVTNKPQVTTVVIT